MSIGQNGIITRAQTAVVINENASVYEQLQFKVADYQMENITNNTELEILTRLKEDGYVEEDSEGNNILNVENLMGRRMQTGNGSIADGDVYVLEKRQETASSVTTDETSSLKYYLIYYGENNSASTNLGLAFEGKTEEEFYEPTDESYFEFDEAKGAIVLADSDSFYGSEIFQRKIGLKLVVVPSIYNGKTVTSIGQEYRMRDGIGLFGINASDIEKIIIPDTVLYIRGILAGKKNHGAFYGCISLKEIKLSKNLRSIGSQAFLSCSSLNNVIIPESVTVIEDYAFYNCSSLTTITIPAKVIEMGSAIFEGCTSLETINVPFNKGEQPEGWNSSWSSGCNATIVYANGETEQLNSES